MVEYVLHKMSVNAPRPGPASAANSQYVKLNVRMVERVWRLTLVSALMSGAVLCVTNQSVMA